MGAQIRIIPQTEADAGFGLLKDIIDMVKNPKAISDAYEQRRQAAELTDDEVKKSEVARGMIAQADALSSDLKKREDALEAAKLEHQKTIDDFVNKSASTVKELAAKQAELDIISAAQAQANDSLDAARAQWKADAAQAKAAQDARDTALSVREKSADEREQSLKDDEARLTDFENKLKAKAARLSAEANNW